MKTNTLFSIAISGLLILLADTAALAQIPQGFSYQSLIRDNAGIVLANDDSLPVRFTVLQGDSAAYVETHTGSTKQFGLHTLAKGRGNCLK